MDTCQYENVLSAYHDGELSEGAKASFEQHLANCPPCRGELEQLRKLSAFMQAAPRRHLSGRAKQDLYALAPAAGEGVYLRIAEWTTALAACILIATSVWLFKANPAQSPTDVSVLTPVVLDPPQAHDAAEASDDPQLVDWISANVVAGQNQ